MKKAEQQARITEFLLCLGNGRTLHQIEAEEAELEAQEAQI